MPELTITSPGLYDLPAAVYHGDPVPGGSLSQSRAKVLLREAGAALFKHRETAPEHKPAYDLGTAAHALALGKGAERLVVVDADSWRTAAARAERAAAYAAGKTPILNRDMGVAEDMADALSRHKLAVETLTGQPEVSMFDQLDGLWLRGQVDVLGAEATADYKTTSDASAYGFSKQAWRFRYHLQAAWYRRMRGWLTGEWLPYRIVAQESEAPYLVSVWEYDELAIRQGEADMDDAIAIYRRCIELDQWPGYPDEIQTLSPPDWALDDEIEID